MIADASRSVVQKVEALELDDIVQRLTDRYGWEIGRARESERDYRLFLVAAAEGLTEPPTQDVDDFWHQHILDTRRYHRDCQAVFGGYLHHEPVRTTGFDPSMLGCIIPPGPGAPPDRA